MVDFSERLKTLRLEKNLTQQQVAERIHVTKSMISAYETAIRCPSYDILIKLATLFHVSVDFLLGREKEPTLDITGLNDTQVGLISNLIDELRKANS